MTVILFLKLKMLWFIHLKLLQEGGVLFFRVIGYIYEKGLRNPVLFNPFLVGRNCLEDSECQQCFYMPICSGGYAWYRLRNLFCNCHYDLCAIYKGNRTLDGCLELHYENLIKSGNDEN